MEMPNERSESCLIPSSGSKGNPKRDHYEIWRMRTYYSATTKSKSCTSSRGLSGGNTQKKTDKGGRCQHSLFPQDS